MILLPSITGISIAFACLFVCFSRRNQCKLLPLTGISYRSIVFVAEIQSIKFSTAFLLWGHTFIFYGVTCLRFTLGTRVYFRSVFLLKIFPFLKWPQFRIENFIFSNFHPSSFSGEAWLFVYSKARWQRLKGNLRGIQISDGFYFDHVKRHLKYHGQSSIETVSKISVMEEQGKFYVAVEMVCKAGQEKTVTKKDL